MPNLQKVKDGFDAMKDAARKEIQSVGLDPDDLPDYQAVNRTFMAAGKHGKNIPKDVADKFPKDPFEVAKLNQRATESAKSQGIVCESGSGNPAAERNARKSELPRGRKFEAGKNQTAWLRRCYMFEADCTA